MEPFKNQINEKTALIISKNIKRHFLDFDENFFKKNVQSELEPLELKDRVRFLANKLHQFLPRDFKKTAKILAGAVDRDTNLSGFNVWPLTEYISIYGLDHLDESMLVLKEMTKVFTSEFAVRAFFIKDQEKALKFFKKWMNDEDEHVRRLVSEGSRPLLPWGQKLPGFITAPQLTLELLEHLKNDESLYVRKSVANHLNDHSKNHPDLVVKTLQSWQKKAPKDKNIDWIIRHASRTLVKKAHPKALALHGVSEAKIKLVKSQLKKSTIKLNESLEFEIVIQNLSQSKALVIIDIDIALLKSNQTHSDKCFKGKKINLEAREKKSLSLRIPFKKVTTRTYYSGVQYTI